MAATQNNDNAEVNSADKLEDKREQIMALFGRLAELETLCLVRVDAA